MLLLASGRFTVPLSYPVEVLADLPRVYYRLEQTGTANPADSSGNGFHGALGGDYTWEVPGARGTALRFGGSTSQFSLARQSMTGNISRVAWVNTTSTDATKAYDGNAALTIFGDTSGGVWDSFGVHNGKARYTRFNGSTWQTFDSATSVNDGNWHLIAVTYDSSTRAVVIYVDGVADGPGGTMTAHNIQGGVSHVGVGFGSPGDRYVGDLDELELHNTVLSAARIAARYAAAV